MKKRLGMITRQVAATFRYKRGAEAHCKGTQNTWRNISNIKRYLFAGGSAPQNGGGTAGLFQNFWNLYIRGRWLFWRSPKDNWTRLTGSMEWEDPPRRRFHATPSLRKILSAQSAMRWETLSTFLSAVLNISLSPPQVMSPPSRIFQCSNGHLICEECKQRQEIRSCPTCRSRRWQWQRQRRTFT